MEKGESTSLTAETKTRVKTRVETGKQIVELVQTNPSITREKLASTLGLTIKGVDWQIAKLKTMGILRRVGSKKGGHWKIVANLKETP